MKLPPLPEPFMALFPEIAPHVYAAWAAQMTEYGRACAAAERERCAKVCEGSYGVNVALDDEEAYYGRQMAAAIRALKENDE